MKHLILVLSLLAAPAWADDTPPPVGWVLAGSPAPATKKCAIETSLTVMAGSSQSGPLDVGVTNGVAALHLDAGAILHGPITIMICDGKVEISGAPP